MKPDNKNKEKNKGKKPPAPPAQTKIAKFLNPYTFVLTPDRSGLLDDPDLGDHDPVGLAEREDHSRYWAGRYSGHIAARLKTKTPLFITDPNTKRPHSVPDHYLYDTLDYIPATALKGVISSAYETITNSRYRVFNNHFKPDKKPKINLANFTHTSLRKASLPSECSPGERLFGWVNGKGSGAWKGKVRVTDGRAAPGESPVQKFSNPLPLAILGKPRPETGRFYLGNEQGKRQGHGIADDDAFYKTGPGVRKKIRGRKVYLHHQLACDDPAKVAPSLMDKPYWSETNTKAAFYKQFIKSSKSSARRLESDQNRSIGSWIPPGKEFTFRLYVENLTGFELGALLCLFDLGEGCYFRMGLGKPLGLGSVSLNIDAEETALHKNAELAAAYSSLLKEEAAKLSGSDFEPLKKAYQARVVEAYGKRGAWEDVSFIKGLLFSMRGGFPGSPATVPVIYPQTQIDKPEESFRWFNLNEKGNKDSRGSRLCLPDPTMDSGENLYLPLQPTKPRGGYGGGRRY